MILLFKWKRDGERKTGGRGSNKLCNTGDKKKKKGNKKNHEEDDEGIEREEKEEEKEEQKQKKEIKIGNRSPPKKEKKN